MKHLYFSDKEKRDLFLRNEKKKIILKYIFQNVINQPDLRFLAQKKMENFLLNGTISRLRSRCSVTNRSRGIFVKKFKLSRIKLRELLFQGLVPGYKKATW